MKKKLYRMIDTPSGETTWNGYAYTPEQAEEKCFWDETPAAGWKKLVARFANGRPLCNCRCAYLPPCGKGIDREGNTRTDLMVCADGCSANLITTRNEIANQLTKI